MIEHCISALRQEQEEREYRTYVTDAMKAVADNTSRFIIPGFGEVRAGVEMTKRWSGEQEATEEQPPEEDNRSTDEIVSGIWQRMKGGTEG